MVARKARSAESGGNGKSRIGSHSASRRQFIEAAATGLGTLTLGGRAKAGLFDGTGKTPSAFKQLAIADYQKNMQAFGGSLTVSPQYLMSHFRTGAPWQFDIAVIGSGYGASITAARLAQKMRPGTSLCVLERGREWITGTFPDTLKDCMDETRLKIFGMNKRRINNPTGLFNVLQGEEITVMSGNAIGGSSLINAAVAIKPDAEVFMQTQWPSALRDMACLEPYFDRAAWELHARVEPVDWTCKMQSQRLAAEKLRDYQCHYEASALTVTRSFQGPNLPVLNRHGMVQRECTDCGDCITGCNVGAKNTLPYNYLPMARRAGAMIFGQTEVRRIEKCHGFYRVHYIYHHRNEKGEFEPREGCLTARIVVLGAGSVGSSEILMRSQSESSVFSTQLGCNWTGNGDALGFVVKSDFETHVQGVSADTSYPTRIGPTIQSNITYPCRPQLHDRILIQEGAAPRAYTNALGLLMRDMNLDHTLVMLGMGHDRQEGKIVLEDNGNGVVEWPGVLNSDYRKKIRLEFGRVAHGHGGNYKYLRLFGDRMISVHPLGGCAMSDDPRSGVVNHKGQVYDCYHGGDYDPNTGEMRIHEGLYVSDGAIFPTAIACNPHLTIAALAERNAQLITLEPKYADLFDT